MPTLTSDVLARTDWTERMRAHAERADALTAGRRHRAARGETHPVDDFLYTYYSYKPAVLRRWHPGRDVRLADAADSPHAGWRWYRSEAGTVAADADAFLTEKAPLVRAIRGILSSTLGRTGSYGCFGLHEWAMVYRDGETRHPVPLRLGAEGTDAVVEAHDLRCTHIDAFRFFTPDAAPRNRFAPTRDTQALTEQPGCLHAGMDLYKWAVKLGPLVPGELLLDAFVLARDIRELDMRASPYDLSDWGYSPVPIETPAGKAEYVAGQRRFTERSQPIRARLLALIDVARENENVKTLDPLSWEGHYRRSERMTPMSTNDTPTTPDLERLVGGEQDGLPPAPMGAPDDVDTIAPEARFHAPRGGDLEVDDASDT